jgi:hypothetical protein
MNLPLGNSEQWFYFILLGKSKGLRPIGMHRISGRPVIRPDNPTFFDIRYPVGYQIGQPDIR